MYAIYTRDPTLYGALAVLRLELYRVGGNIYYTETITTKTTIGNLCINSGNCVRFKNPTEKVTKHNSGVVACTALPRSIVGHQTFAELSGVLPFMAPI